MFEYTPTIEDRVAFSLAMLDKFGKAVKKQRRLWFTGLGASLLVFMLPVDLVIGRVTASMAPGLGLLVTWLVCGLIWLGVTLVWPNLPREWLVRRLTTQVKRRVRTQPLVAMSLWLDPEGLSVGSAAGQIHFAWSVISGVSETQTRIFVLLTDRAGIVLPKRVDPAAVAAFAAQLRANLARSRQPVQRTSPASPPDAAEDIPTGAACPHRWDLPVGVVPLSAFSPGGTMPWPVAPPAAPGASFPPTALPMLSFTTSIDDLTAAVLDFPPRLQSRVRSIRKAAWRRWPLLCLEGFALGLLCNRIILHLDADWAVFGALAYLAVVALLRWSRFDHTVKRLLPVAVEKEARRTLARGSDQRRVWADSTGLTVADAVLTQHFPWRRVHLVETDRHVIVGTDHSSLAIPRHVGPQLRPLVQFARSCGVA